MVNRWFVFPVKEALTHRIFGLDLLRSIAIILVVLTHSHFEYIKDLTLIPLPDGVDLFFVLSGYLVGMSLIKTAKQNQGFNLPLVLNFLQRRWFRTLPNYFLFLLINILLIYFGIIKGVLNKYLVTFFVFFQNFHKPYDFLFWESWSLSLEEWFYLLFPFTVLCLARLTRFKMKSGFLFAILVFLASPLIYRVIQFQHNPFLDFDLYFRKLVLTRLDTIGFGLAGAYAHCYYPKFWGKSKNGFFILGLGLLMFLITSGIQNSFFLKTLYFSLMGLSILFLLPKLESFKSENIPLKPFRFLSNISYAMYLVHMPLIQITFRLFNFSNAFYAYCSYFLFWIVLLILSYFVYKVYERPLMNLRERDRTKALILKISSLFSGTK